MNIFIDCGSNLGQGFEIISKELNINSNWNVFMIEPNPKCVDILKNKYNTYNFITIIDKAIWINNEKRLLNVEYCPEHNDWVGGATNIILQNKYIKPKYIKDEYLKSGSYVECIDFSEFVMSNFKKEDNICIKFDIEGAEFDVLDKMINDKTIDYVNTFYVEWHNHLIPNKKSQDYYIDIFKNKNIDYHIWY